MEYIYYITTVLVILAVCYYKARVPSEEYLLKRDENSDVEEDAAALVPDVSGVPVPWGWPGSDIEHQHLHESDTGMTDSMHRWVDHLVATKHTVEDEEYRLRRENSMRALLEDRFVSPSHMNDMEYRNTQPPLLRDPSQPHDQMDNFPSGRLNKIESKLHELPAVHHVERPDTGPVRYEELKEVRTPWGW